MEIGVSASYPGIRANSLGSLNLFDQDELILVQG